jgi:hypothetical protein
MSFFVDNEPWPVEIEHDGETKTVWLRELAAGDEAELDDMLTAVDEEGVRRLMVGSRALLTVQRAVVRWDLDVEATPISIAALQPAFFDKILKAVNAGRPTVATAGGARKAKPGASS